MSSEFSLLLKDTNDLSLFIWKQFILSVLVVPFDILIYYVNMHLLFVFFSISICTEFDFNNWATLSTTRPHVSLRGRCEN